MFSYRTPEYSPLESAYGAVDAFSRSDKERDDSPFLEGVREGFTGPYSLFGMAGRDDENFRRAALSSSASPLAQELAEEFSGEEEWRESDSFRETIEYYQGMTRGRADHLAKVHDREQEISRMMEEATTWEAAKFYVGSFAGGIPEPINVASSIVGGVLLKPLATVLPFLKPSAQVATKSMAIKQAAKLGIAEGAVGAAITEPLYMLTADDLQLDYGLDDSALNLATSAVVGSLTRGVGGYRQYKKAERDRLALEAVELMQGQAERGKMVDPEDTNAIVSAEKAADLHEQRRILEAERQEIQQSMSDAERFQDDLRHQVERLENADIPAARYGLDQGEFSLPVSDIVTALDVVRQGEGRVVGRDVLQFMKQNGGIHPDQIASLDITPQTLPGLIKKSGQTLEQMRGIAEEAGFLPEGSTTNDLLDAIDDAVRTPTKRANASEIQEAEKFLDEVGVDTLEALNQYKSTETENLKLLKSENKRLKGQISGEDLTAGLRSDIARIDSELGRISVDEERIKGALGRYIDGPSIDKPEDDFISRVNDRLETEGMSLDERIADVKQKIDSIDPETAPTEWKTIDVEFKRSSRNVDAFVRCSAGLGVANG